MPYLSTAKEVRAFSFDLVKIIPMSFHLSNKLLHTCINMAKLINESSCPRPFQYCTLKAGNIEKLGKCLYGIHITVPRAKDVRSTHIELFFLSQQLLLALRELGIAL